MVVVLCVGVGGLFLFCFVCLLFFSFSLDSSNPGQGLVIHRDDAERLLR